MSAKHSVDSRGGIVRARLRERDDAELVTREMLDELATAKRPELLAWLEYALHEAVRVELGRVRMVAMDRVRGGHNSIDRVVVRVPVAGAGGRMFRTLSLADCGPIELITLAELLEQQARLDLAKARGYRRLAAALAKRRKKRVGDLPTGVITAALETDESNQEMAA